MNCHVKHLPTKPKKPNNFWYYVMSGLCIAMILGLLFYMSTHTTGM